MSRRHVTIIHRWASRYAEYEKYLDHDEFAVTYISTAVGSVAIPAGAAAVEIVSATDDLAQVRTALHRHADVFGPPAAIVGLKEDDLLCTATLRAEWGCPGPTVEQLTPFRNKLTMLETVSARGIRVPTFADTVDARGVREFAEEHGWPIILKPHLGSASEGVRRISEPAELADLRLDSPMLVQAFVPHPIYHVDGVFDGTALGPWRASGYLNDCLNFRVGTPLGSVEEDDPAVLAAIGDFTHAVLAAMTTQPVLFHLEVFVDRTTGGGVECTFLEIGARVGGGEIAFVWRDVHGHDLMHDAFRIAMGEQPADAGLGFAESAGWLLVPAPAERPCVVEQVTSMVGRQPGPYAEELLAPGTVLPAADSYYEHVGGRFRFRGPTGADVREAIIATARDFHVAGTSVEAGGAGPDPARCPGGCFGNARARVGVAPRQKDGNENHFSGSTPGGSAMARNELRPIVTLRSTAGTGSTYVTRKSRRNDPDRLVLRKYDPAVARHVEFREER